MIARTSIEKLKGHTVRIEYLTKSDFVKVRIGTLIRVGFKNVHVEHAAGWEYCIPIATVREIKEVSA